MDIFELNKDAINSMTELEAKNTLEHIREQFQERYMFLLGTWSGSKRAKSTRDGKFVSLDSIEKWIKS